LSCPCCPLLAVHIFLDARARKYEREKQGARKIRSVGVRKRHGKSTKFKVQ
jgi:hypothetical protein